MGGPSDPPEGTPDGFPGGAEDEYRSVVFDESFVRAARLQEFSAHERTTEHAPAVRSRPSPHRRLSRQALILVLLIAVAFGTALYMGVRHPYQDPAAAQQPVEALRSTVVPLAPTGEVPGTSDVDQLFAQSPAAHYKIGADGIALPASRRTANFSDGQVINALTTAKDYLVRSSLYPEVLSGEQVRPVRILVDGDQLDQFDRSFQEPAADGRHAPTGWLVRFDPTVAQLADDEVRVQGSLRVTEADSGTLEVTTDHTFVYALRPADSDGKAEASLFTVRRELHFRFDRDDLRLHQTQVVGSSTQAGPLSCAADSADQLRPLLAGETATGGGPAGTDPYSGGGATALCGTLADRAQPKV
ncbi:hypothetical protein [Streptomyces sp. B93]|uniref:SCO2583 family membrane protein n=1 Tax=Streptomyces sp. B93 TaxID=2824875 RepID=UPI001B38A2A9|nr:hypothetical protein [Streptomyces sp. B93]MBQ1088194.1 hypothetical protein [Streptomyces sp. B93]